MGLGLGLDLVRMCSDGFEVRDHPAGGVELWMRFAVDMTRGERNS